MEESPITRAYLESLTTSDLITMADNLGVDIPSDLDRVFIIGEILEISSIDEETVNSAENGLVETDLVESVPLPKHYSITFIEMIIRDPLWAFVFWEIKSQDKEQIEKSQDFEGYYLKVSPYMADKTENSDNSSMSDIKDFRIQVKPDDTAWYLGLSPAMFSGISQNEHNRFKVELCAEIKGEETVLAASSPVKLPVLSQMAGEQEINPLISLSGYADFHIIRNNERQHRQKKVETSHE